MLTREEREARVERAADRIAVMLGEAAERGVDPRFIERFFHAACAHVWWRGRGRNAAYRAALDILSHRHALLGVPPKAAG